MHDETNAEAPPEWWKVTVLIVAFAVFVVLIAVMFVRAGGESGDASSGIITAASNTDSRAPANASTIPSSMVSTVDQRATTAPTTSPRITATTRSDETSTTSGRPTTEAEASAATEPRSPPAVGYPTNPDGSPLPLVVIFDTDTITVSGQLPSQAAKDRLTLLAIANSQFPEARVVDNIVINPDVPITVGVRVIELNSARFPEGTADILPPHALELDRVVSIMNALPNISVLVIGHADQRGDDVKNFAISDERARAVVSYLLYLGIAPTRLASRAAGESDLLTVNEDKASLALNRRTEFIFTGLLVE